MSGRSFTAGLLLGLWAGSLLMAVVGFGLQRETRWRTLPRPETHAAPLPGDDPADRLPPQNLPIPTRPAE